MTEHKRCRLCGEPIVLVPSAAERAKKTGYPASYFTALFDTHAECTLAERRRTTSELMARLRRS